MRTVYLTIALYYCSFGAAQAKSRLTRNRTLTESTIVQSTVPWLLKLPEFDGKKRPYPREGAVTLITQGGCDKNYGYIAGALSIMEGLNGVKSKVRCIRCVVDVTHCLFPSQACRFLAPFTFSHYSGSFARLYS